MAKSSYHPLSNKHLITENEDHPVKTQQDSMEIKSLWRAQKQQIQLHHTICICTFRNIKYGKKRLLKLEYKVTIPPRY